MLTTSTEVCEGCKYLFKGEQDKIIHERHCDNEGMIKIMDEYYGIKCRFCEQDFRKYSMVKEHEFQHYLSGETVKIEVEKKK